MVEKKKNLIYIVLENGKIKNIFSKDLNVHFTILDLDDKTRKEMDTSIITLSDNKLLNYLNEIEQQEKFEYYRFSSNILKKKKVK